MEVAVALSLLMLIGDIALYWWTKVVQFPKIRQWKLTLAFIDDLSVAGNNVC